MLNFIGTGSAFNTKLGNNGAFIKKNKLLFMIDCGSATYARINESNLLEGVEHIYVLMTHTHPDHIGSLGDLIFHGYYSMGEMFKPSVTVIAPSQLISNIEKVLDGMGVPGNNYYRYFISTSGEINYNGFNILFQVVPVTHVKELTSFAYILHYENKAIYYSGDSNEISPLILERLNFGEIDLFYQDTSKLDYEGNVHLSLRELAELVNEDVRDRVFCMHLDKTFNVEEAKKLGFNVATSILEEENENEGVL